jgi:hypothetical protein
MDWSCSEICFYSQGCDVNEITSTSQRFLLLRAWLCRAGLFLLPLLLAAGFYYRPAWQDGRPLPLDGDAWFYSYQMTRAGESHGRWWRLADDDSLGQPYPTIAAKHPGLYEGVDLMLVSALTSRVFSPVVNYHVLTLLVLAVNGWVVGYLAYRLTRSHFWAGVAILLVTLNLSTAQRLNGHLHLFKHAWIALAAWTFARCLERPSVRRGLALGASLALVLQSSFYIGYFITLAILVYCLGCLLAGRLNRQHWIAGAGAGLTYLICGAALTFPVWTSTFKTPLSDVYFHRYQGESSIYSSEIWQYFVSPHWKFEHKPGEPFIAPVGEGWHYPGYLVLAGLSVYAAARLRGWRFEGRAGRFVDVLLGLTAILVVVSLKNGPSVMLSTWVSCFRCYGRAGLATVALWSLATPIILAIAIRKIGRPWLRAAIAVPVMLLAVYDGYQGQQIFFYRPATSVPSWVSWLANQPADVHLAAFSPCDKIRKAPTDAWDWDALYYRLLHRHRTLNGCEPGLLEGDLRLLGASYETMNPLGLRYIVSLGYETLAFHADYLNANRWIAALPWLDRIDINGDWHFYRANDKTARFPMRTMSELLSTAKSAKSPTRVPAMSCITEPLDIDHTVVVAHARTLLCWADANGHIVGRPTAALFQHAFGPGLPAYTIQTPAKPGTYQLLFLEEDGRTMGSRLYEVVAGLATSKQEYGDQTPPVRVWLEGPRSNSEPLRVIVDNPTRAYVQAHGNRPQVQHSIRAHPLLFDASACWADSLCLVVWHHELRTGEPAQELRLLLPRDIAPGERIVVDLPKDLLNSLGSQVANPSMRSDEIVDVRLDQVGVAPFAP